MRAPYDGRGYRKPAGHGWSHGTIRSMLRNERYIGRFTWNKRQWLRSGPQKKRTSQLRPPEEWVAKEIPELAIVPSDLWEKVQRKLGEKRQLGAPSSRTDHVASPVSGLLRCGTCGSRMSISGQVKKGGATYRSFACSANRAKGPEVCPNSASITERKVLAALAETISQSLAHPKFFERFHETFLKLFAGANTDPAVDSEAASVEADLRKQDAKRSRLVDLIENGNGDVEALVERLRQIEQSIRGLRTRLVPARTQDRLPPVPPDAEELLSYFRELVATLTCSPADAREALQTRLTPIRLTPRPGRDGHRYVFETVLKMNPAALVGGGRKVCYGVGCGGRI